ncbi:MAG TPA: site-2 protease family protein [Thermomicrobiales bacterium]|jgi:Zn-dependent protease|nr:site-2 protease family protein [Thermomicrobiales bacterium]
MPGFGEFDPQKFVSIIVTFVIAITVHEFMHAWTAWKLGDDTARLLGRVSLNPVVHFDPVGAMLFVLIALGLPGIAWGKPVPVNDFRLRPAGRLGRHGSMALVSFAGPLSNVVLGAIAAGIWRLSTSAGVRLGEAEQFLQIFVIVNFSLAAFNMIPLPPLDGSRILVALLPAFWRPVLAPLERYGVPILILLLISGSFLNLGINIGSEIIRGITDPMLALLLKIFVG